MFKIGELVFSYFLGKRNALSEKTFEISAEILNQLRRILILVVLTLGSLALFCMGMSHLIERFLNNIDHGDALFTPSIWFVLGFLVICAGVMVYATRKQNWMDIFKAEKREAAPEQQITAGGAGQLESVISLLILDFVKERESKRARETSQQTKNSHNNE